MSYIDTVDNKIRKCFSIFEPNFPEWLNEYIETDDGSYLNKKTAEGYIIEIKLSKDKVKYSLK